MSKLLRKESPMLKGEVRPQQLQRRTKILRSQKVFPISIQTILAFKPKTRAQQLQKLLSRKRNLIGWTYSRSSTLMLLYLTLFGTLFARSVIQSLNSSSIKNFCLIESLQTMFRSLWLRIQSMTRRVRSNFSRSFMTSSHKLSIIVFTMLIPRVERLWTRLSWES